MTTGKSLGTHWNMYNKNLIIESKIGHSWPASIAPILIQYYLRPERECVFLTFAVKAVR